MAEKTIGQKLYEQMHPYDRDSSVNPSSWRDTSANLRASYEAAASAVWDEAMEACINRWKPIDDIAKDGKSYLFVCRWKDQVGHAEERIVLRWEIDGWFDWDGVKLHESIPVLYLPIPPAPDTEEK